MKLIFILLLTNLVLANVATIPQRFKAIESHNQYRMEVNPPARSMPQLIWSNSLAVSSNSWASQCIWAHSGTPGVGENLYATSARTPNPATFDITVAVKAWGDERIYYNYTTNTCQSGQICGHYTQVVWATTTQVGCAIQDCPQIQGLPWSNGGTIVVCQYSPPGNYVGQRPYVQTDWVVNWSLLNSMPMKQISARGGNVWGIDPCDRLYRLSGNNWILQTGNFNTLGATFDGNVWGTDIAGRLGLYNGNFTQIFTNPPARTGVLRADGINVNSVVVIDNQNNGWHFSSGNWFILGSNILHWITEGAGFDLWMVDSQRHIFRWFDSVGSWVQYPGLNIQSIYVSDLQNIVVTGIDGSFWQWQRNKWVQIPGSGKQIIMDNGIYYAIDANGGVWIG